MRVYKVVLEIEMEAEGVNGSNPNPRRVRDYIIKNMPLGKDSYLPLKAKALRILSVSSGRKGYIHA